VKLTLAKSDEPAGASAGLLFWAKDYGEYYYAYLINGGLTVARWIGGRWLYPVSLRENAAIKKGLGETNQLRLVTKGAQATLFVNGTEIVSFKGQPPQGGSLVGLRGESSANSPAVWEFSGLKITKP
ncbi:MAG TPA: hypothetical protein VLB01_01585, partial [Thermodesulfobacteriota bacterium]|nr:hypothetical protein [Thermodesulfobacteriota bacterium]